MYRKDYILRMVEMLAELIAGILGLIKNGKFDQAEEKINETYADYLQEDAAFFVNIPIDQLTHVLMQEHNYTHDHLDMLAELFYAEGELLLAQEKTIESLVYFEKSLRLATFVEENSQNFSFEKQERISHLKRQIECINQ